MSHSTLYADYGEGTFKPVATYANGWGAGPFVWDALVVKAGLNAVIPMMAWEQLFKWAYDNPNKLTWWEKATLESTYDRAIIPRGLLLDVADAFDCFAKAYGKPGRVSHYTSFAEEIRRLYKDERIQNIAFQQTSVNENPWQIYEKDKDECRPYNLNTDKGHWFLKIEKTECVSSPTSSLV